MSGHKWAARVGLGITINNTSVTTTSTTTSQNNPPPPDQAGPITNTSTNLFYRVGFEYRYRVNRRILAYAGLDFVGSSANSTSNNVELFNNLPNEYQFSKTTEVVTANSFGGGAVVGIQCFLTRRLSLLTEVPVYFLYTSQSDVTTNYQNVLQFQGGPYVSTTNTQTQLTKGSNLAIVLPVTIYLCLKF